MRSETSDDDDDDDDDDETEQNINSFQEREQKERRGNNWLVNCPVRPQLSWFNNQTNPSR